MLTEQTDGRSVWLALSLLAILIYFKLKITVYTLEVEVSSEARSDYIQYTYIIGREIK